MGEQTVTVDVLAKLCNVSPRYIQKLAKEGLIPKASHGQYPVLRCVSGYIKFLQECRNAAGGADMEESKKRKAYADALLAEIDVANSQGRLISVEGHGEIIEKIASVVKIRLMSMPSKLSQDLCHESEPHIIKEILEQNVRETLEETGRVVATFRYGLEEREATEREISEGFQPTTKVDSKSVGRPRKGFVV